MNVTNADPYFWHEVEEDTRTDRERDEDSLFAMVENLIDALQPEPTGEGTKEAA